MNTNIIPATLDHVFVCTAIGAPEADALRDFGLAEGAPNRHPGQGTACRRFFFRSTMLELLWVADIEEARDRADRRLRLWERCQAGDGGISPFGIILRPAPGQAAECPFASWEYRPPTMPDLCLQIAADTELTEPLWGYVPTGRAPVEVQHPSGLRDITGVRIVAPAISKMSTSYRMAELGLISLQAGWEHRLEFQFDGAQQGAHKDFRPLLPLVFRW